MGKFQDKGDLASVKNYALQLGGRGKAKTMEKDYGEGGVKILRKSYDVVYG